MLLDYTFRFRDLVVKARGPVDGDGDGWVYDGTPRKRPATPAERAAGARLRAQQGGAAPKKAAAKNDYDKRYDKFDRAINQAIRSKSPAQVKEVQRLIQQDLALKKPDRDDLVAVLQARRDGKPDPAPVKGGNREKRGVKGPGPDPLPQKPAAQRPGLKKPLHEHLVQRPKPEAKERTDYGELRGRNGKPILPPKPKHKTRKPLSAGEDGAASDSAVQRVLDKIKAAPDDEALNRAQQTTIPGKLDAAQQSALKAAVDERRKQLQAKKKPGPVTRAHQVMREAGLNIPDKPKTPNPLEHRHQSFIDRAMARDKKFDVYKNGVKQPGGPWHVSGGRRNGYIRVVNAQGVGIDVDKENLADYQSSPPKERMTDRLMRRIGRFKNVQDTAGLRREMESFNRSNARSRIRDDQRVDEAVRSAGNRARAPKDTHGPQTKAWQRLAQRDIAQAQDFRKLKGLMTQVNNKERDGRIRPDEAKDLRDKIKARLDELGLDQNGRVVRPNPWNRPQQRQAGDENPVGRWGAELVAERLEKEIIKAKNLDELNRVKALIGPAEKKLMRDNPDLMQRVNGKFRGRKAWLQAASHSEPKSVTVQPKVPPGEGRARAKAKMPPLPPSAKGQKVVDHYVARLERAYEAAEAEWMMIDLNKDWEAGRIDDAQFAKAFDALEKNMARIEQAQKKGQGVPTGHPSDFTPDAFNALHDHFAGGGGIADAPEAGLWNYLRANPDRFAVKPNGNAAEAGANSASYWVDDLATGERWVAKMPYYKNDIQKENVAAAIMFAAGHPFMPTRFGSSRDNNEDNVMLQRHLGEVLAGDREAYVKPGRARALRSAGLQNLGLDKGKDPGVAARLAIYDYLIDNQEDRHGNNIGILQHKDGRYDLAIFDQGLAFGSFQDARQSDRKTTWSEFYLGYRAQQWNIAKVMASAAGYQARKLEVDLRKALDGFNRVDVETLRDQYASARADPELRQQVELWLLVFAERRDWLNKNFDQMVRHLVAAGGAR